MNDVIRVESARKYFGPARAVDGLTFAVREGSVVGFLGLNGSGKTTTMRLLTGLMRAEAGVVRVLGEDPWTMGPDTRRRIGYLSEKDFPFPQLTFEQAVSFTSRVHPRWDADYLERLVRLLAIPTRAPYQVLSRGQQRKYQLALTLAPRPEIILLDDPAQGLDVTVRRDFVESILPLLQEGRSTVLFSSHIMSDVERIADSIAVLHEGRLILQESLDTLKEYACRVVVTGERCILPPDALCVRRAQGETRFTLLRADEKELEPLRRDGGRVELNPLGLEDLFVDLVNDAESR
ncbi:MAG: ABC transporter ATP-binding protein [Planctomycetes bacterium]|nr:ABC transporter ATP-binding protein [Planctomycetota bacterium]